MRSECPQTAETLTLCLGVPQLKEAGAARLLEDFICEARFYCRRLCEVHLVLPIPINSSSAKFLEDLERQIDEGLRGKCENLHIFRPCHALSGMGPDTYKQSKLTPKGFGKLERLFRRFHINLQFRENLTKKPAKRRRPPPGGPQQQQLQHQQRKKKGPPRPLTFGDFLPPTLWAEPSTPAPPPLPNVQDLVNFIKTKQPLPPPPLSSHHQFPHLPPPQHPDTHGKPVEDGNDDLGAWSDIKPAVRSGPPPKVKEEPEETDNNTVGGDQLGEDDDLADRDLHTPPPCIPDANNDPGKANNDPGTANNDPGEAGGDPDEQLGQHDGTIDLDHVGDAVLPDYDDDEDHNDFYDCVAGHGANDAPSEHGDDFFHEENDHNGGEEEEDLLAGEDYDDDDAFDMPPIEEEESEDEADDTSIDSGFVDDDDLNLAEEMQFLD